jgi:hypothetical protein
VVTPPFPEYCSGHSTFSAVAAYVLQKFTGSDTFAYSYTAAPRSSVIEPGVCPASSITMSWPTYSAAAAQAGVSRQIGGIHFDQGDQDGRALGRLVRPRPGPGRSATSTDRTGADDSADARPACRFRRTVHRIAH